MISNIPNNILKYKTAKEAVQEAINELDSERKGEQLGLLTRFQTLNRSAGKYFRFANVYLIAGLSGHGKSAFLNMLRKDFLDKKINNIKFKTLHLHFCYEMKASDELLRELSNEVGKSYSYLLSSEYDRESKDYNVIGDEEFSQYKEVLEKMGKKPILYFETAGNLIQLYNTVEYFFKMYPNHKLVVSVDHTLLSEKLDEGSDIELMANTGKIAVAIRKHFGAMVILLGQMNNNIEDIKRIKDKTLHFPMKSDIYAQSQVFNACDHVYVFHRPELLRIEKYGYSERPTKGLIHCYKLKSRHGVIGSVWFKEDFLNGRILEITNDNTDENLEIIANNV